MSKKEVLNKETGELIGPDALNVVKYKITPHKHRLTPRIQQDFSNCPTLTEQHTAHLSDINYLMERYAPDELAQYISMRNQYRKEILGHDFSQEPTLQEGMNAVVQAKKCWEELSDDLKNQFRNPTEFFKFIDNPANQEKMIKLGLLKQKDIDLMSPPVIPLDPGASPTPMTPTKNEEKDKK